MASEPRAYLRMLMDGVVVEDNVDQLAGRNRRFDGVEEADELLMAVTLHVAADDGSVEDIERSEQGGGAMALVVVGQVPARPFFIGRPGWVRSSAWIWLFSSTESTMA